MWKVSIESSCSPAPSRPGATCNSGSTTAAMMAEPKAPSYLRGSRGGAGAAEGTGVSWRPGTQAHLSRQGSACATRCQSPACGLTPPHPTTAIGSNASPLMR